ncbi:MAG: 50S ribosomal protein L6 [Bacteroidota bacterium]|jgi:large subunit ribosomal protein L6
MSRIGKKPIELPKGVTITVGNDHTVNVKGPLGELSQFVDPCIKIDIQEKEIVLTRETDQQRHRAMHGLYRALLSNMVVGVSKGFTIEQELVGVGYKAVNTGQMIELSLGYSHHIFIELPSEIKIETTAERGKNPTLKLTSHDKQLLGLVAAKIRSLRKPEPYKGKGIKFVNEILRRKSGKSAAAAK